MSRHAAQLASRFGWRLHQWAAAVLVAVAGAGQAGSQPDLPWLAVGPITGTGADCSRLLAPGQRVAVATRSSEPERAALITDDGRLLPLLRKEAPGITPDDARAPLALVAHAGGPTELRGSWPQAACQLDGPPLPAGATRSWIDDELAGLLIEAAADTETRHAASMRPGGLQARAERRRATHARAHARLGDASAVTLYLHWQSLVAAIDAGAIIEDLGPGEQRLRTMQTSHGATAHATAEALVELVGALGALERDRAALALLEASLPAIRDAAGASHRQVLQLERQRASALASARGQAAGQAAAEALLAQAERVLAADDPLLFDCRLLMARALLRDSRYGEGIAILELLAQQIGDERSQRAAALQDRLAAGYTAMGRLSEGLLAQQRSFLMAQALFGPNHPDTLRGFNNLADNLRQLNDNDAALPYARRAYEGYNQLYGAGHSASVISARGLSLILGELGQPEESLRIIEPQIAAATQRLGPEHRQTLNTRIHQGELLDLVGRPAEAAVVLEDLLAPATRQFGESGELTIVSHTLLAGAYVGAGDHARARAQLAIAVERIGRIGDQRRALSLLGVAAQAAERVDDPGTLELLLRQFVDIAEQADRSGLSEDTASQVQVFRSAPYLRYVALLAERGDIGAAFDRSERFKGRVLLATLGEIAGDASPALPAQVRTELADLRRQVRAAEAAVLSAASDAARVDAGARREAAAQAYLSRRARARRDYPRFAAVADAPVLGTADVERVLAADTCLLSFVVGESRAGVFVLARGLPIRYLSLPPPKDLDAVTRQLRSEWSGEPGHAGAADAGTALSRALSPAITACPRRATKLAISPDGALALLPFELIDTGGGPLGGRFAISYVQSFSVYGLLRQRTRTARYAQDLLAVGAPTFPRAEASAVAQTGVDAAVRTATVRGAVSGLGRDPDAARRAFDALGVTWSALPGAEREARASSGLFPRHRLLLGDEASEDQLSELNRRGELGRYRYLLFSTHGYLSLAHPSLSAIVLRQPGSAAFDGYLTAAELPLYDLDSELIVMSACETGVGPVRAGSGVMGLPLALMIAGNRNAVVTLWRVPDASAAEFVVRLFRHLRAGQPPASALARTKRELAKDRRYRDPLHWAGFVLYGAP